MFRKRHDRHCAFKAFVQAGNGRFSDIPVVINNAITDLSGSFYSFAPEHLLQFCPQTCLVFLRSLIRYILREAKLSSLQTSDTADLENDVPQSVSITFETFRVDTPFTTISAMPAISAASLRE